MKNRELIGSLFWIGVGVIFCTGALKYRLFKSGVPGAGLFPFIGGIILITLSFVVLISSLKTKEEDWRKIFKEKFFPQENSWKRILFALLALFAYWIALEYLGFLLTTFLFMTFLLRFIEPQSWITNFTTTILTTTASYLLFKIGLKVPLPKGILGMWIGG